MTPLRWGLAFALGGELAEPVAAAEVAEIAEATGWDAMFVWDHLWHRDGVPLADPWITMAAIALATERIRIGPMVTPLPRRRPQVVAQQATTLDRLSNGRLVLGLGLGTDAYGEFSAFGSDLLDDRARAAELERGLDLLLPALEGGLVAPAGGRRTSLPGAQRPRCPIWLAGRPGNPAGPRRAADRGLEGVALVGAEHWTATHVRDVVSTVGPDAGLDIALVGGDFAEPDALRAAGASWAVFLVGVGTSSAQARELAGRGPGRT